MAACKMEGCKLGAILKSDFCAGHHNEVERRCDEKDVKAAIELVQKTPWTVLWSVKRILDGHHPHGDDNMWFADVDKLVPAGRLELRENRFHYKVDKDDLFRRNT